MNEAAAIRTVFPKHAAKLVALRMGVPYGTAREWLYRRFSKARTRELALALLVEMDEQDRQRAELRAHLKEIAGADGQARSVLDGEGLPGSGDAGCGASSREVGGGVVAHQVRREAP